MFKNWFSRAWDFFFGEHQSAVERAEEEFIRRINDPDFWKDDDKQGKKNKYIPTPSVW